MLAYKGDPRGQSYVALSRWLRDHTFPSDSVAFMEIGYLGYYTDNRIIDLAGLILPDAHSHIAKGDFAWSFWQYKPDYYIYWAGWDWALASIRADPSTLGHKSFGGLGAQGMPAVRPFEGLGHCLVKIINEGQNTLAQFLHRGEARSFQ